MLRFRNKATALMLVCILYTGCASRPYIVHPGAVNTFDSVTYDSLMAAQTTIEVARAQIESGVLTPAAKPLLNGLITAYNVATPAYKVYHDAASKGLPTDQYLAALNKSMTDLAKTLASFKGGK